MIDVGNPRRLVHQAHLNLVFALCHQLFIVESRCVSRDLWFLLRLGVVRTLNVPVYNVTVYPRFELALRTSFDVPINFGSWTMNAIFINLTLTSRSVYLLVIGNSQDVL
jgi:hypothetical protein